jgi:hypothetical protein
MADRARDRVNHLLRATRIAQSAHVQDFQQFEWAIRDALGNYFALVRQQGFSERGKLLKFLDQHPDTSKLLTWIRDYGGPGWNKFLGKTRCPPLRQTKPPHSSYHR